jgi:hypothetical protein
MEPPIRVLAAREKPWGTWLQIDMIFPRIIYAAVASILR